MAGVARRGERLAGLDSRGAIPPALSRSARTGGGGLGQCPTQRSGEQSADPVLIPPRTKKREERSRQSEIRS
jgi:hypothetical protein